MNLKIFIALCLAQGPLVSVQTNFFGDEIDAIDRAIIASEKRLEVQKSIKNSMTELRQLEESVMKVDNPKEQAAQMVKKAETILAVIQKEHLEPFFSPSYLEELRFYSSFAHKTQLAQPK